MKDALIPASLYPACESLDEVIADAKTRLPVITENQLISIITLTYKTTLNLSYVQKTLGNPTCQT